MAKTSAPTAPRPTFRELGFGQKLGWGVALLFALIDQYLGSAHRDAPAAGCAVTALAADVARGSTRSRSAYTRQVQAYVTLFAGLLGRVGTARTRHVEAIVAWSTLVGALSIARAVNDEALARDILQIAADSLKSQLR